MTALTPQRSRMLRRRYMWLGLVFIVGGVLLTAVRADSYLSTVALAAAVLCILESTYHRGWLACYERGPRRPRVARAGVPYIETVAPAGDRL